ncbi:MAG: PEP-CTERM sorting domain-containing protein [Verrucomicrobiota bacterium]
MKTSIGTNSSVAFAASLLMVNSALAGPYSDFSGGTEGAPDNPIPRSDISIFEDSIVDYSPAPGVGSGFQNPSGGSASLGDLYSPVSRPTGLPLGFDRLYRPEVGSEPSSFHAGSGVTDNFSGDVNSSTDSYGFIGIDGPGSITVGFANPIFNGAGADFAVFENGFGFGGGFFAELAHVEISTNGSDFLRFPSISLNTEAVSTLGTFQLYDMTNVYNLAGKHGTNLGTPFDLNELVSAPEVINGDVDLNEINFIRLVDVVGSGELLDEGSPIAGLDLDSLGNPILDNWVTFDSSGFDYLGLPTGSVGAINVVPEPTAFALILGLSSLPFCLRRRRKRR